MILYGIGLILGLHFPSCLTEFNQLSGILYFSWEPVAFSEIMPKGNEELTQSSIRQQFQERVFQSIPESIEPKRK